MAKAKEPKDTEVVDHESWITVKGGGEIVHLYPKANQSLLSVIRENEAWGKVFDAMELMPEVQELMVECAANRFHYVAADTIRKMDLAGLDLDAMAEKTSMDKGYINRRLNDLFHAQKPPEPKEG